jgi:hypothetical protein
MHDTKPVNGTVVHGTTHHDRRAMDITASKFASNARECNKLVNSLRSLGAQCVLDLPRVAIIGAFLSELSCDMGLMRRRRRQAKCRQE